MVALKSGPIAVSTVVDDSPTACDCGPASYPCLWGEEQRAGSPLTQASGWWKTSVGLVTQTQA